MSFVPRPNSRPSRSVTHERVAVPLLARLDVDCVDVTGEQQAARRALGGIVAGRCGGRRGRCGGRSADPGGGAAAGVARQAGDELRPPHEVEVRGHEPPAGTGRCRLPQVDLAAQGGEARRQQALKPRFSAGRRTGVAGRRVQGDEGARERHEIVAPRPHRSHDPVFQGGTFGGHVLAASFACRGPAEGRPAHDPGATHAIRPLHSTAVPHGLPPPRGGHHVAFPAAWRLL